MRYIFLLFFILNLSAVSAFAQNFNLTSSSFTTARNIDKQYTCDGKNTSPALAWSNAPDNTKTFVLIMSDPDAPGGTFYHWVVYNIPSIISSLNENALPPGALVAENSFDKHDYNGPCPPTGSTHKYIFTLYALDTNLILPANADETKVINAMQNHILGKTEITTKYGR